MAFVRRATPVSRCPARAATPDAFPRAASLRVAPADAADATKLMRVVYGDWSGAGASLGGSRVSWAPAPLPRTEAGRGRYLWTDAFAVLNFVSAAERRAEMGDAGGRDDALAAALALVRAVHETLGQPSSRQVPMSLSSRAPFALPGASSSSSSSTTTTTTRHVGLRIGKTLAAASSDPGMALDGMYFHYHDKWVFALARLADAFGAETSVGAALATEATSLIKDVHPHWIERDEHTGAPLGVRWKINPDASPIRG